MPCAACHSARRCLLGDEGVAQLFDAAKQSLTTAAAEVCRVGKGWADFFHNTTRAREEGSPNITRPRERAECGAGRGELTWPDAHAPVHRVCNSTIHIVKDEEGEGDAAGGDGADIKVQHHRWKQEGPRAKQEDLLAETLCT